MTYTAKQLLFILLLFLYFMLPALVPNIYMALMVKDSLYLEHAVNGYTVASLLALFSILLFYINKYLLILPMVYVYLSTLINLFHIKLFYSPMGSIAYYAIFETDKSETSEYILNLLLVSNIVLFFIFTFIFAALSIIVYSTCRKISVKPMRIFCCLLAVASFGTLITKLYKGQDVIKQLNHHKSFELVHSYYKYKKDIANIRTYHDKLITDYEAYSIMPEDEPETYIFIIGESANKLHLGLYDYFRDTTPFLGEIRDNIYVFSDVVSATMGTFPSIRSMLSFENFNEDSLTLFDGSLITTFKNAGFKTYWLGNQILQSHNVIPGVFLVESDYSYIVRKSDDGESFQRQYDELLLPQLRRVLDDKTTDKKFIIMHLMGSHTVYKYRYPHSFSYFDGQYDIEGREHLSKDRKEYINHYDNSLRYTDYVIRQIIDTVAQENSNSFVVYISDHGEDVYHYTDTAGHASGFSAPNMVTVPFIVWLSERFKENRPDIAKNIGSYIDRKYHADDIDYTLLDLAGVIFDGSKPHKSVFSEAWVFEPRIIYKDPVIDFDVEFVKWLKDHPGAEKLFKYKLD